MTAPTPSVPLNQLEVVRTNGRPAPVPLGSRSQPVVERAVSIPTYQSADVVAAAIDLTPRERSEVVARIANTVIAATALVLLAPLMLLIALAIKLTSRGPVIYMQTRVGLDRRYNRLGIGHPGRQHDFGGKLFTMFKFRTMCVDAEADGRSVWASKSDPRVTAVGRILRKTRLDELPQLWNVLQGEMNIVGPRPERPDIFERLREEVPGYALRQRVKPGITGWAQINQSYDTCLDDVRRKVELDLEYLGRQSVMEDLLIMTRTLPVMVLRRGAW
jgi:lipopolysaccharide/colanic/teichoic acid biosynthesis glycosyltransferase